MRKSRSSRPEAGTSHTADIPDSSFASSLAVRARMQAQKTRDTAPEMAIRRLLHSKGLRYRVDRAPVPGLRRKADIVFGPARVAIFIDGCFWHGCREHRSQRPRVNIDYWAQKIERNMCRDQETDRRFQDAGWLVIRVWEHEAPGVVVDMIEGALAARQGQPRSGNRRKSTSKN